MHPARIAVAAAITAFAFAPTSTTQAKPPGAGAGVLYQSAWESGHGPVTLSTIAHTGVEGLTSLPPGSYLLTATVEAFNNSSDRVSLLCYFHTGLVGISDFTSRIDMEPLRMSTYTTTGTVNFAEPGTVWLYCAGQGPTVYNVKLSALAVAEIITQ